VRASFTPARLILVALIALEVAAFGRIGTNFFTRDNAFEVARLNVEVGLLAVALTPVIVSGGIDLSVGTLMTFCAVMTGVVLTYWGLPLPFGIAAALATGAVAGAISGTIIAKLKIAPFIATLGMMLMLKGLGLVISGVKPIYFNDTPNFTSISIDSIVSRIVPGLEVPNAVVIMFAVAIVASVILNRSILGRYIFALGSNEEAARLSGVNTDLWKIVTYSLGGMICGVAGLLIAARLNSAQPALGQGYELEAIAAVVIGGTSLSGGRGTILGTLIGAFIISVLNNGLRIMGVEEQWQIVVTGFIIIVAVYVDTVLRKRR
jgi:ribose transport system permease protein